MLAESWPEPVCVSGQCVLFWELEPARTTGSACVQQSKFQLNLSFTERELWTEGAHQFWRDRCHGDSKVVAKGLIESSLKLAGKAAVDFGGTAPSVKE